MLHPVLREQPFGSSDQTGTAVNGGGAEACRYGGGDGVV